MLEDPAELSSRLAGGPLGGRTVSVIEMPRAGERVLTVPARPAELLTEWTAARALLEQTGRWPVAATAWSRVPPAPTLETFWLDPRGEKPIPPALRQAAATLTGERAIAEIRAAQREDAEPLEEFLDWHLDATRKRCGAAPDPEAIAAAFADGDGRRSRRWLGHRTPQRHLRPATARLPIGAAQPHAESGGMREAPDAPLHADALHRLTGVPIADRLGRWSTRSLLPLRNRCDFRRGRLRHRPRASKSASAAHGSPDRRTSTPIRREPTASADELAREKTVVEQSGHARRCGRRRRSSRRTRAPRRRREAPLLRSYRDKISDGPSSASTVLSVRIRCARIAGSSVTPSHPDTQFGHCRPP